MLVLPIKKNWYDMILSGEKREEYREIKSYYTSRFKGIGLLDNDGNEVSLKFVPIMFRNGYSEKSPSFVAFCWLSKGYGRVEWGAEKDKKYYRLHIAKIETRSDEWEQK